MIAAWQRAVLEFSQLGLPPHGPAFVARLNELLSQIPAFVEAAASVEAARKRREGGSGRGRQASRRQLRASLTRVHGGAGDGGPLSLGPRATHRLPRKTLDDLFHDTLKDIYFAEKRSSPLCRRWQRQPRTVI